MKICTFLIKIWETDSKLCRANYFFIFHNVSIFKKLLFLFYSNRYFVKQNTDVPYFILLEKILTSNFATILHNKICWKIQIFEEEKCFVSIFTIKIFQYILNYFGCNQHLNNCLKKSEDKQHGNIKIQILHIIDFTEKIYSTSCQSTGKYLSYFLVLEVKNY